MPRKHFDDTFFSGGCSGGFKLFYVNVLVVFEYCTFGQVITPFQRKNGIVGDPLKKKQIEATRRKEVRRVSEGWSLGPAFYPTSFN